MYKVVGLLILLAGGSLVAQAKTVRIATYNVSMEASNYLPRGVSPVAVSYTHLTLPTICSV